MALFNPEMMFWKLSFKMMQVKQGDAKGGIIIRMFVRALTATSGWKIVQDSGK